MRETETVKSKSLTAPFYPRTDGGQQGESSADILRDTHSGVRGSIARVKPRNSCGVSTVESDAIGASTSRSGFGIRHHRERAGRNACSVGDNAAGADIFSGRRDAGLSSVLRLTVVIDLWRDVESHGTHGHPRSKRLMCPVSAESFIFTKN